VFGSTSSPWCDRVKQHKSHLLRLCWLRIVPFSVCDKKESKLQEIMPNHGRIISLLDRMEEIAEENEAGTDQSGPLTEERGTASSDYNDDDQVVFIVESSEEDATSLPFDEEAVGDDDDELFSADDEEEADEVFVTIQEEEEDILMSSSDSNQLVPLYEEEQGVENNSSMGYEDVDDLYYEADGGGGGGGASRKHPAQKRRALGSYLKSAGDGSQSSGGDNDNNTKRSSFHAFRRSSTESERTAKSAPARTGAPPELAATVADAKTTPHERRVTVHDDRTRLGSTGAAGGGNSSRQPLTTATSQRRRFKRLYGNTNIVDSDSEQTDSGNSSQKGNNFMQSLRISRRRSTTRQRGQQQRRSLSGSSSSSTNNNNNNRTMADAVELLGNTNSTDFEHVAAAAAVVAAASQTSAKRGYVQFGQGDHVLVMLTLLGMADVSGDKESYTVDPVNALGYPQGQGKTESQKQGPFLFVLCTVTQVHFDEDERYYTVRRFDTGSEQRADPGYMEPIRDADAIEVALGAAQRRSLADPTGGAVTGHYAAGLCHCRWIQAATAAMVHVLRRVVTVYTQSRRTAKTLLQRWLHGENGYACTMRFSGINFLVLCSLIFLFYDVLPLIFLSKNLDQACTILGL
jgi:hypothetical protein